MRLALEDDSFAQARSFPQDAQGPTDGERDRLDAPAGRAPFTSGEALALATAMRFRAVRHASMSAGDLDAALRRLSTRHLQALLTLEQHSRAVLDPSKT